MGSKSGTGGCRSAAISSVAWGGDLWCAPPSAQTCRCDDVTANSGLQASDDVAHENTKKALGRARSGGVLASQREVKEPPVPLARLSALFMLQKCYLRGDGGCGFVILLLPPSFSFGGSMEGGSRKIVKPPEGKP